MRNTVTTPTILKFLDEIAHHPVILDVMEDLLGRMSCSPEPYFSSRNRKPLPLSVGIRIQLTPVSTKEGITVWVALSEARPGGPCR